MKRWIAVIACLVFVFALTACDKKTEAADENDADDEWDGAPAITKIKEAYNDSALAAGRAAVYAQRFYESTEGRYADTLEQLAEVDKNILTDPDVVFVFGSADENGFTFTTSHKKGNRTYVFE